MKSSVLAERYFIIHQDQESHLSFKIYDPKRGCWKPGKEHTTLNKLFSRKEIKFAVVNLVYRYIYVDLTDRSFYEHYAKFLTNLNDQDKSIIFKVISKEEEGLKILDVANVIYKLSLPEPRSNFFLSINSDIQRKRLSEIQVGCSKRSKFLAV